MEDLLSKIDIMKNNLQIKDIKSINKNKFKTIPTKDINKDNELIVKEYNYYVKLTKKIKRYLKNDENIVFEINRDRFNRIICLMTNLKKSELDVFFYIDIRLITGNTKDTLMRCTYYNKHMAILYINEFSSGKPNNGYGSIILKKLDYIVEEINIRLDAYNHYYEDYKFNYIYKIEGLAIPTKSIINQENLNKIYRKYGFLVNEKDNMKIEKYIRINHLIYN